MKTIFKSLLKDHEIQRDILDQMRDGRRDEESRKSLLNMLEMELVKHASYEKNFFYKPLMTDETIRERVQESIHEHEDIEKKLNALKATPLMQPEWLKRLNELKDSVEHHLNKEEHEIFQLAGKILTPEQKRMLSDRYTEAMQEGFAEEVQPNA